MDHNKNKIYKILYFLFWPSVFLFLFYADIISFTKSKSYKNTCYADSYNQIYKIVEVYENTAVYVKTIEGYMETYTHRDIVPLDFLRLQLKENIIFKIDCDSLSSSTKELLRRAAGETY